MCLLILLPACSPCVVSNLSNETAFLLCVTPASPTSRLISFETMTGSGDAFPCPWWRSLSFGLLGLRSAQSRQKPAKRIRGIVTIKRTVPAAYPRVKLSPENPSARGQHATKQSRQIPATKQLTRPSFPTSAHGLGLSSLLIQIDLRRSYKNGVNR